MFSKKQGQRLIPEYLLNYTEKLNENHPDPSASWGGGSDATITLTQGGVTKGSFTLNQSGNQTIDLELGGAYYEIKTNNIAFYEYDGTQATGTSILPNLTMVLSEGQFEALKEKMNPVLVSMGLAPLTDIESLIISLNQIFTETTAVNAKAVLTFMICNGYCNWFVSGIVNGVEVRGTIFYNLYNFSTTGNVTYNLWYIDETIQNEIPYGISATWTLSQYGTSGSGSETQKSFYNIKLVDYNLDSHSENDLIMILDPQEFKSVLDEVNTQMGTNLQTPQDLITFYDSVKGDVNYYGGCCLLFSAISQLCLMHKRNIIYRDYDLRAYNIVTSAIAEPIPQVASENMVVISALAPSNLTSITFTQDSTLTITSQTNEYIDD